MRNDERLKTLNTESGGGRDKEQEKMVGLSLFL